ncbi:hypothetical protein VTI28DRAFT_10240 [Corynascus sepedonium]
MSSSSTTYPPSTATTTPKPPSCAQLLDTEELGERCRGSRGSRHAIGRQSASTPDIVGCSYMPCRPLGVSKGIGGKTLCPVLVSCPRDRTLTRGERWQHLRSVPVDALLVPTNRMLSTISRAPLSIGHPQSSLVSAETWGVRQTATRLLDALGPTHDGGPRPRSLWLEFELAPCRHGRAGDNPSAL